MTVREAMFLQELRRGRRQACRHAGTQALATGREIHDGEARSSGGLGATADLQSETRPEAIPGFGRRGRQHPPEVRSDHRCG